MSSAEAAGDLFTSSRVSGVTSSFSRRVLILNNDSRGAFVEGEAPTKASRTSGPSKPHFLLSAEAFQVGQDRSYGVENVLSLKCGGG